MARSMQRLFRFGGDSRRARQLVGHAWSPAADIYRTSDGWIVKVELAGVCLEDLQISISANALALSGCRRDTFVVDGLIYQQLEITYSRFEKRLQFPCSIEGASIVRDYRDGFLIIHLSSAADCTADDADVYSTDD